MAWVSRDGLTAWVPDVPPDDDLDAGWRCACGRADLVGVVHSAAMCVGAEQDGENE